MLIKSIFSSLPVAWMMFGGEGSGGGDILKHIRLEPTMYLMLDRDNPILAVQAPGKILMPAYMAVRFRLNGGTFPVFGAFTALGAGHPTNIFAGWAAQDGAYQAEMLVQCLDLNYMTTAICEDYAYTLYSRHWWDTSAIAVSDSIYVGITELYQNLMNPVTLATNPLQVLLDLYYLEV